MCVAVVFAGCAASHFFNGDDAAIEHLAAGVFELDGGVADLKVVVEHLVELEQDAGALRRWNVGDGDVAGEGAGLGAEAPDVEVVDVETPSTASMPERITGSETPRGVPSSRMLRVSRTMPKLDQRMSAAMTSERTGSIQFWPVSRMPAPPAMTAAVESVSPAMWRKALCRLTSLLTPHKSAAMMPFISTPAAATTIMSLGWTATGAERRWMASTAIQSGDDDERACVDEGSQHAGTLIAEGFGVAAGRDCR